MFVCFDKQCGLIYLDRKRVSGNTYGDPHVKKEETQETALEEGKEEVEMIKKKE